MGVGLAVDGEGAIWAGAVEKLVRAVPETKAITVIAPLSTRISDSPVFASNGDVIVGDQSGLLHRFTPAGSAVWSTENLGAALHTPIVLSGGRSSAFCM